jgi:hypothetical protein
MTTTATKQITENDAYYMGRNDYWNEFSPEADRAAPFAEAYNRGYRHARSEDRLNKDTEWD